MKKFWNWIRDDTGGRVLRLEGPIDDESFWGDEVTPKAFRDELESEGGDITVWINSPGGNVFAAAEIYTMLKEYAGAVTVRIASIAASAASVVAVAGDQVQMSPTALLMIHDPMTIAMGNTKDMEQAIKTLNEVKESIINAYVNKTGLRRSRIAELMSNETWMNAKKALELGFADEVLYDEKKPEKEPEEDPKEAEDPETEEGEDGDGEEEKKPVKLQQAGVLYSSRLMGQAILNRIMGSIPEADAGDTTDDGDGTQAEPAEDGVTQEEAEKLPADHIEAAPVIGMDGKTADGAMPFAILEKQLEYLK